MRCLLRHFIRGRTLHFVWYYSIKYEFSDLIDIFVRIC